MLPAELFTKFLPKPAQVALLHDEGNIRLPDVPGRDADARAIFGASGSNLVTIHAVEDGFGGKTSQAILAADQ